MLYEFTLDIKFIDLWEYSMKSRNFTIDTIPVVVYDSTTYLH